VCVQGTLLHNMKHRLLIEVYADGVKVWGRMVKPRNGLEYLERFDSAQESVNTERLSVICDWKESGC
jgi:hypothetical protein